jgi:hypothetical protein
MSYHQDGLIDIFVGIYVLLFGSGILLLTVTDFSTWFVVPAIFPAIMIPVWISAKKRITMPRIGYVNFKWYDYYRYFSGNYIEPLRIHYGSKAALRIWTVNTSVILYRIFRCCSFRIFACNHRTFDYHQWLCSSEPIHTKISINSG